MNNQELNNRRLASLCGINPYSNIFNSQQNSNLETPNKKQNSADKTKIQEGK